MVGRTRNRKRGGGGGEHKYILIGLVEENYGMTKQKVCF